MLGLFILVFFGFIGFIGWSGTAVILPGAIGGLFLFGVVCLESLTLVRWAMDGDES
ncbi:MAG: hypothetical protein PHG07_01885 [Lachnospiraceae bacterium]|nr:hypothetical protein [Lachnospiraceae bacterium]